MNKTMFLGHPTCKKNLLHFRDTFATWMVGDSLGNKESEWQYLQNLQSTLIHMDRIFDAHITNDISSIQVEETLDVHIMYTAFHLVIRKTW